MENKFLNRIREFFKRDGKNIISNPEMKMNFQKRFSPCYQLLMKRDLSVNVLSFIGNVPTDANMANVSIEFIDDKTVTISGNEEKTLIQEKDKRLCLVKM